MSTILKGKCPASAICQQLPQADRLSPPYGQAPQVEHMASLASANSTCIAWKPQLQGALPPDPLLTVLLFPFPLPAQGPQGLAEVPCQHGDTVGGSSGYRVSHLHCSASSVHSLSLVFTEQQTRPVHSE
ncbi:hypothetical protein P7K49_029871 [Saguinus oedipus]|uniref:Uncharacterized protein n=1 Tax=Saguinus oedipus TaxID=9490 RepID=A0ABQ9U8F1_SAGOE|nr:hypothetical protein P7K49_029871 [Saguinus oedipus]